jgi:hypothetical protein
MVAAAKRIMTWWHGYRLARRLEQSAIDERIILDKLKEEKRKRALAPSGAEPNISPRSSPPMGPPATPSKTRSFNRQNSGKPKGKGKRAAGNQSNGGPVKRTRTRSDDLNDADTTARASRASPSPLRRTISRQEHDNSTPSKPEPDRGVFYELIGECYVHRMMRGEAIDHQVEKKLPSMVFEIR